MMLHFSGESVQSIIEAIHGVAGSVADGLFEAGSRDNTHDAPRKAAIDDNLSTRYVVGAITG
jgi:hypothetical protein